MMRYALISLRSGNAEQICRYLPGNYEKIGYAPHDPQAPDNDLTRMGPCIVIAGRDNSGWGLDSYVIPRLQSGLHACREIDLSHPVMKTLTEESK